MCYFRITLPFMQQKNWINKSLHFAEVYMQVLLYEILCEIIICYVICIAALHVPPYFATQSKLDVSKLRIKSAVKLKLFALQTSVFMIMIIN